MHELLTPVEPYCFKAHFSLPPNSSRTGAPGSVFDLFQVNFVSMHCTGNTLASGGSDGFIRHWNMRSKVKICEYPPRMVSGQAIPVACGGFNPEGTLLAYALSYDWSLGRDSYSPQYPKAVMIKLVRPNAIAS